MGRQKATSELFSDLPVGILEKSLTYVDGSRLTGGSNMKCQCGWNGPFLETAELRFHNRNGDRLSTYYLCRKSMHILAGISHVPPVSFEEQREAADQRRAK